MPLNWIVDNGLRRAVSVPPGYVIEWSPMMWGGPLFYNAWRVEGDKRECVRDGGGFDRAAVKAACEADADKRATVDQTLLR